MKINFHLLFYLKKQKNYQDGPVAIYMRITVNGKRAEISAGRECDPSRWNARAGKGIGTKEDIRALNSYLETLQNKVKAAHQTLVDAGKIVTAESLRDQFTGKEEKSRYLVEIFNQHNQDIEALIGNGFELNTLKGYKTTKSHLEGYLQKHYVKSDVEITLLDHAFVTGFEFYLKTTCKLSGVSAAKYIKNLKKIVNFCVANSWLKNNPFVNYKNTAKAKERLFLTEQELDTMTYKKLSVARLKQVRDIFIFCCYTGLSYADVKKLKRSEIGVGIDGEKWIFTSRQKTDTSSRIPLLPTALEILERYKDNPQCENKDLILPVLTNQKMNAYLQEIADLCDITKHLTFHLSRHTFATTVTLSNNVPIETVSKMLGHTSIKTTQHYAKILDLKVSHDMGLLKKKFGKKHFCKNLELANSDFKLETTRTTKPNT